MLFKHEPKTSNMPQQGSGWPNSRNNIAKCCVEILRSFDQCFSYDNNRAVIQLHHEPSSIKRFRFKSLPKNAFNLQTAEEFCILSLQISSYFLAKLIPKITGLITLILLSPHLLQESYNGGRPILDAQTIFLRPWIL